VRAHFGPDRSARTPSQAIERRVAVDRRGRGVRRLRDLQSCAIGYWVSAQHEGRGVATEAVAQVVDFAFNDLSVHPVQAETLPENVGSRIVLERNGFELFGLAPKYLKINGEWRDHLMFQLLNDAYLDAEPGR
jgi:RimJ/RimL family protein N-acetyltransferase